MNILTEDQILSNTYAKELLLAAPLPLKTDSYSPLSHQQVINLTLEAIDKANLKVTRELYSSARAGKQAQGSYIIQGDDVEMQIKLQFHNSYDKSMPLRWAVGANIIVCTNGMVAGDIGAIKRKHTGGIVTEFMEEVQLHINTAGDIFERLKRDKERMKNVEITKRTCAELLGRMHVEENIITATQLGIVKKELDFPTFDYKADGTLWQFYNHNTVALKEAHPQHSLDQHMNLHNFITKEYAKEFA